jgi:hypothetical protein
MFRCSIRRRGAWHGRSERDAQRFLDPQGGRKGEGARAGQRLLQRREAHLRHIGQSLARHAPAGEFLAHAPADLMRVAIR